MNNTMFLTSRYLIGIDTGVNTGYALYDRKLKKLLTVDTTRIHNAIDGVKTWNNNNLFVRVEDARLRNWFGKSGREKLQGAGSVKRDSKIWSDFLTDEGIPFEMVAPKNNVTKISAEAFKKLTGYTGRTSEHGRAAAMLVWRY